MAAAPAIPVPPGLLSPAEESLLEALARPGADLASLAAAHSLSLSALARRLGLPHVRRAFDALREIAASHANNPICSAPRSATDRPRSGRAALRADLLRRPHKIVRATTGKGISWAASPTRRAEARPSATRVPVRMRARRP